MRNGDGEEKQTNGNAAAWRNKKNALQKVN